MKKLLISALIILLCSSVMALDRVNPIRAFVGGGVSPLTGDFGDYWNLGFHGLAGIGLKAAPNVVIMPKVEYHSFGLDKQGLSVSGGTLHSLMISGDVVVELGLPTSTARPFIIGGVGMASVSASDISGQGMIFTFPEETKVCFELGGGVNFRTGPSASLFLMARYVTVATEDESLTYIPLSIGFKF